MFFDHRNELLVNAQYQAIVMAQHEMIGVGKMFAVPMGKALNWWPSLTRSRQVARPSRPTVVVTKPD